MTCVAALAIPTFYFKGTYEQRAKDFETLYNALNKQYKATGNESYLDAAKAFLEAWTNADEGKNTLEAANSAYNTLVNGGSLNSKSVPSQNSAEYYEEQGKARLKAYEESRKINASETVDKAAEYDKQKKDLDYLLDMELISEADYYARLAVLRDTYLDENSDKWRSANVAIHKYQKSLLNGLEKGAADDTEKIKEHLSEVEKAYKDTLAAIDEEIARHNRQNEDEEMEDKKAFAEETYTAAKTAYETSAAQLNDALSVATQIFSALGSTAQSVSNTNTTNNTTQNNSFLMNLVGSTAEEIVEAVKKALSSDI